MIFQKKSFIQEKKYNCLASHRIRIHTEAATDAEEPKGNLRYMFYCKFACLKNNYCQTNPQADKVNEMQFSTINPREVFKPPHQAFISAYQ